MKAKEIIDMFPKFSKREEFVEEAIKDNEINELYNKALNARYILDLPPGNSHSPDIGLPCGRLAISTRLSASIRAAAATRTRGLVIR